MSDMVRPLFLIPASTQMEFTRDVQPYEWRHQVAHSNWTGTSWTNRVQVRIGPSVQPAGETLRARLVA